MRIGEGVEWAAHCLLLLDWMGEDRPVPTARLAAGFELPPPYLNKQLQALVKAGLVTSTAGARGGFRLARPLEKITMMDVVAAIEGPEEAFQCTEIRSRGAGAGTPASVLRRPCAVSTAMRKAELAWRRALAEQTLADVSAAVKRGVPEIEENVRAWYARN
ncbi:Rrf2 family transcriptional regulator [Actinomadura sp. LD22]|uniref:Rrf2 family transcriptional regulator n=1 Tax=Actinomadura physcomitrii TaxID=2650748 RepID=A0A6I4MJN9_9ACTN|nr:Rrf2 family transcriptional regulator [Actinomadura physcomitrii]MWA05130.1 Rrf2 family transcriptional regulator [Actinomadura physcomitrii]